MAQAPYSRHSLRAARRAGNCLGLEVIDKATASGKNLLAWRANVISDQGGEENVTAAKLALIDAATTTRYVIGSVDAWILRQENLLRERADGSLHLRDVILERGYVVNLLRNLLTSVGLEREARQVPRLHEYLAAKGAERAAALATVEVEAGPATDSEATDPPPEPEVDPGAET